MPQVSVAVGTEYFDAVTVGIYLPAYGTLDFVIKSRPAAVRVKLVFRAIQGCVAAFAGVITRRFEVIRILARKGHFGSLAKDHLLFFGREVVEIGHGLRFFRRYRCFSRLSPGWEASCGNLAFFQKADFRWRE